MKTVICCINSKYIHSSLSPWCLFSGVKAFCRTDIAAKVVEGTINEQKKDVISRIVGEKPQVLAFCTYIWNIDYIYGILPEIKKQIPGCIIAFGGPEVSYNAEEVLEKHKFVDYVLSGEGEESFPEFLDCINGGLQIETISGLNYRKNNKIITSPPCILKNDPVSPYSDEYFAALNGRIAYLETSRGCPYSCAFCLSGRCGKERFFDIDRAKSDLLKLSKSGTKTVKLVDRTFNANKLRAKELFRFIIDNYGKEIPDGVCFHFEIAGDILDDETISILSCSPVGAIQLEIGLQSFNEKTLAYINRKTDTEKLKKNILKLCERQNIHIHIDLIAGLPFEDIESFKQSFNTAYSLNSEMLQLGFLKLLYGAQMRDEPKKYPCEYSKNPPYEVISTPWINKEQLEELKRVEDALDRVYNSGRFRRTIAYAVSLSGLSAYDLYKGFSDYLVGKELSKIHIDVYSKYLFDYLSLQKNIDVKLLRDKMVCDRLSSNPSGAIPDFLKIADANFKKIRNTVNELYPLPEHPKRKRGFAILYSEKAAVFTDYEKYNPVLREYELNVISLER